MKKQLEHLRSLPLRQRKLIVFAITIFVGIIGLATYPLWRSGFHSWSTPSIVKKFQQDYKSDSGQFSNSIKQETNPVTEKQKKENTFEKNLSDNEYFTNEEQNINSVAVNVRKVLLDADKTIVWFRISNLTNNAIQFDPKTNFDITSGGLTYLSQPLNNTTLATTYTTEEGQAEILSVQTLAAQSALEGYVAFQKLPKTTSTFTVHLRNMLNQDTIKKWSYSFLFDVAKLKQEKAVK